MLIQSGVFGLPGTMPMYIIGAVITAVLSYLIGSVNFCRMFSINNNCKSDVLELREKAGIKGFVLPLLLDLLKGIVCATIGLFAMPGGGYICLAGLFCTLGHNYPIIYKFKSNGCAGGCAAFIGVMLVFNPLMALVAIVIGLIIFIATKYVNAFVLVFSLLCPILSYYNQLWKFEQGDDYFVYIIDFVLRVPFPFVLMLVVLIFYGNAIGKMVRGKEDKLNFKQKKQ